MSFIAAGQETWRNNMTLKSGALTAGGSNLRKKDDVKSLVHFFHISFIIFSSPTFCRCRYLIFPSVCPLSSKPFEFSISSSPVFHTIPFLRCKHSGLRGLQDWPLFPELSLQPLIYPFAHLYQMPTGDFSLRMAVKRRSRVRLSVSTWVPPILLSR